MTEWSGPFSTTTDFNEDRWRRMHATFTADGVDGDHGGTDLQVTAAGDGLTINIAAGYAVVQSALYHNDATLNKSNSANGGGSARPDRVVLRYDPTGNSLTAVVREGTVGAAAPPALSQTYGSTWDVPLARWSRSAGGGITSVVDERMWTHPDGTTVISDAAITTTVPLTALIPSARKGARVLALPSFAEYRYSGSFWERVDPAPLLSVSSTDAGVPPNTTFSANLTGSSVLSDTFVAPASGRINVQISAKLSSPDGQTWAACRLTGPTSPDLGDPDNSNPRAIGVRTNSLAGEFSTPSLRYPVSGLTAGGVYTATFMTAADDNSNVTVDLRRILIERG